jgi:uncharacterized protein (DUF3084 family)
VRAQVLGADAPLVSRADFRFAARRASDRTPPFAVAFRGRRGTVRTVAYLSDGRARSFAAPARCR